MTEGLRKRSHTRGRAPEAFEDTWKRLGSALESPRQRSKTRGSAWEALWNHHGSPREALPKSLKRPPGGAKTCGF